MNTNTAFQRFVDSYPSQAEAGRALGRSRVTVNRVYHGHLPVSLQVARRIAAITDGRMSIGELLGDRPPEGVFIRRDEADRFADAMLRKDA